MTRRFFVEPPALESDRIDLPAELAHRILRVLRLRAGQEIALFDGSGVEALVRLTEASDRGATGEVIERSASPPEPHVALHLYQSITKGERFEWLLEKGTEIGVAHFAPIIAARAVVKTTAEGNRAARWRRIVVEAAEQCERGAVPSISPPQTFSAALASAPGVVLVPYEEASPDERNIAAVLHDEIDAVFALGTVSIFIGPEGGWEPGEVEAATAAGAHVVTLGQRVLRSETAGLVAATIALHALGELG